MGAKDVGGPGKDQAAGSLIGQCLGDALGFVVEGQPPAVCRAYVDDVLRRGKVGEGGRAPFAFGQYSDDSQLAREFLESYVAKGRFEPADYAHRIAAIFAEGRIVGRGRSTEAAAQRLAAGVEWQEAGTPAPSAGNGSAMRAGPVGLLYSDDPRALIAAAHDQGRITHADPRCSAGAVAIAGAVALAAQDGQLNRDRFVDQLTVWAKVHDDGFAIELRKLKVWLGFAPERAAPVIARAGLDDQLHGELLEIIYRGARWEGISPFVTPSVLWALYSFLRSPDDYWETICTAIAVGGDVDTTAAMAGAIAGARVGLGAIPKSLARTLNDKGAWDYEALVALARRAHEIKQAAGAE